MKIAMLGASGATGYAFLPLALAAGHDVRALVRDPGKLRGEERIAVVAGDARDRASVREVVGGAEAVVSTLGPRPEDRAVCSKATENVLAAMSEHGVRRYVLVSGGAINMPGDKKTLGDRLFDVFVRRMERGGVQDKQRELEMLLQSSVDWTAVRVPRLIEGAEGGRVQISLERLPSKSLRRADLARFLLRQLDDSSFLRKAPFLGS